MARALTPHESIIRKALPYGATFDDDWGWHAWPDGYETERVSLTEEEATLVNAAAELTTCTTCGLVIEDGERMLTYRHYTFCESHGEEYLAERAARG